jgi:hypothetical protein
VPYRRPGPASACVSVVPFGVHRHAAVSTIDYRDAVEAASWVPKP